MQAPDLSSPVEACLVMVLSHTEVGVTRKSYGAMMHAKSGQPSLCILKSYIISGKPTGPKGRSIEQQVSKGVLLLALPLNSVITLGKSCPPLPQFSHL